MQFRGEWVHVDLEALRRSARFLRTRGGGGLVLDVLGALGAGRDLPAPVTGVEARGVLGDVLSGDAARRLPELPDPPGLRAVLRPYQQRGLNWLAIMARWGSARCSPTTWGWARRCSCWRCCCTSATAPPPGPTLLVCPMSWSATGSARPPASPRTCACASTTAPGGARGRASRRGPAGRPRRHHLRRAGPRRRRPRRGDVAPGRPRRGAEHQERRHRAGPRGRALAPRHRVALTGTPVENRLEELRVDPRFVNPGMLGARRRFRARFAVPIERRAGPRRPPAARSVTGRSSCAGSRPTPPSSVTCRRRSR